MLAGAGSIQGVVRFLQLSEERCLIDGTIDGLEPGPHGLHVHTLGDLTLDCLRLDQCFIPVSSGRSIVCSVKEMGSHWWFTLFLSSNLERVMVMSLGHFHTHNLFTQVRISWRVCKLLAFLCGLVSFPQKKIQVNQDALVQTTRECSVRSSTRRLAGLAKVNTGGRRCLLDCWRCQRFCSRESDAVNTFHLALICVDLWCERTKNGVCGTEASDDLENSQAYVQAYVTAVSFNYLICASEGHCILLYPWASYCLGEDGSERWNYCVM